MPIACRKNESTMMILENAVVMIRMDGASARTVSNIRTWRALDILAGSLVSSTPNEMVGNGMAHPLATGQINAIPNRAANR